MANEKNLVNLKDRTPEERKEIARKGAEATNKLLKERRTLKEELLLLLESGNTQEKISLAMIQEALGGNIRAFEVIRDTIGEKPTDKIEAELNTDINITIE
jgi:hypothetical protein